MSEARSPGGPRSAGRRRAPAKASAGMPSGEWAGDRIAELEARLARLEESPGLRARGRSMMDRVVPPEAGQHFRNAGREQLLGVRSIVNHWIQRIDAYEARLEHEGADRETIEIE